MSKATTSTQNLPYFAAMNSSNLLQAVAWSHIDGVTASDKGLTVTGIDRTIAALNNGTRQPSPFVNVGGPVVAGNKQGVTIHADFRRLSDSLATLRIYQNLPITFDEWRYEVPSIAVSLSNDEVLVEWYSGESSVAAVTTREQRAASADDAAISLEIGDGSVKVVMNGQVITTVASGTFSDGPFWFGVGAATGSSWQLARLDATLSNGDTVPGYRSVLAVDAVSASDSLRALTRPLNRSFKIGAAVSIEPLAFNATYRQIVAHEFSSITPENTMKPQFLQPEKGVFTFAEADLLVEFAQAHQQTIHGHTLVFGEANPIWMTTSQPKDRSQIMTDHIKSVVSHFGSAVDAWDVINEPMNDEGTALRSHLWFQAMGEDYLGQALRAAREAGPTQKLFINEYGLEQDGPKWTNFLALVDRLLAAKVPLDGIGFQAHVHDALDEIDSDVLRRHMQQLAQRGLVARISEIDVDGEDEDFQAEHYVLILKACLAEPNCSGVTTWGVSDAYGSTTLINSYPLEYGNDLLYDELMQPKSLYRLWQDTLKNAR